MNIDLESKVISGHIREFKGSLGFIIYKTLSQHGRMFSRARPSTPWNGTQGGLLRPGKALCKSQLTLWGQSRDSWRWHPSRGDLHSFCKHFLTFEMRIATQPQLRTLGRELLTYVKPIETLRFSISIKSAIRMAKAFLGTLGWRWGQGSKADTRVLTITAGWSLKLPGTASLSTYSLNLRATKD